MSLSLLASLPLARWLTRAARWYPSVDAKVVAHCRAGAAAVTETWVHDCVKLDSKLPWAGRYEAPLEQPCPASPDSAVLHGVSFFALGFDDEQLAELEHVITRVGGTVYADARNEAAVGVRYVLTPHGYVLPRRLQLRLSAPRVSPMWLERTLATQVREPHSLRCRHSP